MDNNFPKNSRKILIVGNFFWEYYEPAMAKALGLIGWSVAEFQWRKFRVKNIFWRIQYGFNCGPLIDMINRGLIRKARDLLPDVIFINRGWRIKPNTLKKLREYTKLVVSYHNDDPWGKHKNRRLWKYFLESIPLYDINFVYRRKNIEDYLNHGAKEVYLLKPYFMPELHRPIELSDTDYREFGHDVVFIGHCENDMRIESIRKLYDEGIDLHVWGRLWDKYLPKETKKFGKITPVYGEDYTKAICASKIALNFFSKINNDGYTRRVFEIPACRTLLMSEYSSDITELYEEDKEVVLFGNSDELLKKVKKLLVNPTLRKKIAFSGYKKCLTDKHDVTSRMKEFTKILLSYL
jgi:spore maturation protein CgeB